VGANLRNLCHRQPKRVTGSPNNVLSAWFNAQINDFYKDEYLRAAATPEQPQANRPSYNSA
ncbi:hypothetical protein JVW24_26300, partial [Vibrio cholerae O1]|nr:hypothetical protein [Vibrio cholerae O1]